ncbi:MAG: acylphosphatase [Thermoplasmatota archaeon]
MKRAHVFVSGIVQGVYFRESTKLEALEQGVRGWVRNLDDGRVEAVFEGPPAAVERMIAWCHMGSRDAKVTDVQGQELPPQNEPTGFRVLR